MRLLCTSLLLFINFFLANAQPPDTLLVGYNLTPPFVTEQNGQLTGPSVWLWENIADDNEFVYKYKEYTLDDLLEGIQNDKIDLSLSPLTITSERAEDMVFSAPYYIAYASFLQEDVSSFHKTLLFLKSFFSLNFFRAVGALILVVLVFGFLLWLFERKHNEEEFGGGKKGIWEGFWWSAVTMTTVGYGDKSPRSVGGRIIALIWMFTAIIIISGFTASIASSLTVNKIGSAENSIEDFKDKKIGSIKNSATDEWLKNNFFTNKQGFETIDELLNKLENNDIDALAYDRPILQDILMKDTLDRYRMVGIKFNPQFYAIGMRESLPEEWHDKINLSMLENVEKMDWKILLSEHNLR